MQRPLGSSYQEKKTRPHKYFVLVGEPGNTGNDAQCHKERLGWAMVFHFSALSLANTRNQNAGNLLRISILNTCNS